MSRLIQFLVGIVILVAIMQWAVPRWAANQISRQIALRDHGAPTHVAVTAIPFWELASGQFQDIYINAKKVAAGPMTISSARMNWANGQLSVASLLKGQVKVVKTGRLSVTIQIDGAALSRFLAQEGKIRNAHVTITPNGVRIQGSMFLGGVSVPLDTTGNLIVSQDKKHLIFHPTSIDGINLPMMTDIEILNLNTMTLPVPMVIRSVQLKPDLIVVNAGTP